MRFSIFIILSLFILSCNKKVKQIKFDKELWQKGNWKIRGSMIDNIIDDSIFIGKNRNQIIEILGIDDNSRDSIPPFSYIVDFGKKIGFLGLGGAWLFT